MRKLQFYLFGHWHPRHIWAELEDDFGRYTIQSLYDQWKLLYQRYWYEKICHGVLPVLGEIRLVQTVP